MFIYILDLVIYISTISEYDIYISDWGNYNSRNPEYAIPFSDLDIYISRDSEYDIYISTNSENDF